MPTTRWPKGYWCPYEVDLVRLDALRSIGKMRDSLGTPRTGAERCQSRHTSNGQRRRTLRVRP